MSNIVDRIAVSYDSLDELYNRQAVIENRVLGYLKENPEIADGIESRIRIHEERYILEVELVKN